MRELTEKRLGESNVIKKKWLNKSNPNKFEQKPDPDWKFEKESKIALLIKLCNEIFGGSGEPPVTP